MHRMKNGFTLIELMVTLSVAAILLAVAVPNFVTFVQNNRLATQANDLVTMLNYARSEAIKRGARVTVCSSTAGNACAGSTTWDTGLLVFADADGDGVVDGGETVLQVRQGLEGSNSLRSSTLTRVTYQASGFLFGFGANGTFKLCDARGTASARAIVVSNQGRVRTNTLAAEGFACP